MSCSAFPHCQHQQGKKVPEQQLCPKPADSLSEGHTVRSLPHRAVNEAPPSQQRALNSKFTLPEKRRESDINCKLNRVSLFLNINTKSEG